MVDVGFVRRFEQLLPLDDMRAMPELAGMPLLRRGQRLSVQPVEQRYWDAIMRRVDG
jgi:predicted RNA-binding protein with PUA-like domain